MTSLRCPRTLERQIPFATLIQIFVFVGALIGCQKKVDSNQVALDALRPQVSPHLQEDFPINTKAEVMEWVSKIQHCLVIGKWSCVQDYSEKLVRLEEPMVRAFGSWTLGLTYLQHGNVITAFQYFGLAVRDNPNRTAFHKWFSLSATLMGNQEVAQRHRHWAIKQPDGRSDRELVILAWLEGERAAGTENLTLTDILRPLREPSSVENSSLTTLWSKAVLSHVSTQCQGKTKPSYCGF